MEVGESTYCPNGHIFFLTIQNYSIDSGNTLSRFVSFVCLSILLLFLIGRFDTSAGKFLSNVELADSVEILMWDYKAAVMWAWVATEQYGAVLVTIDINTGERYVEHCLRYSSHIHSLFSSLLRLNSRLTTVVEFANLSANGGSANMNFDTKIIYSSLLNAVNSPVWVVVDTNTGMHCSS